MKMGNNVKNNKTASGKKRTDDKQVIIEILNKASADNAFWSELFEKGSEALKDYNLSSAAKVAIVYADINWLKKHVGELTEAQTKYLYSRLEVEKW